MYNSKKTIAVPPGITIKEQLENRGMAQKEFALRMGMSEKHISRLINGKVELTASASLKLESVLGLPAKFWNNLEAIYREQLSRVEAELDMEEDEEIARQFPYAKLASLGWVPPTREINEKVINLRAFFEVAKLGLLSDLKIPGIAFRVNNQDDKRDYALAAWAQKARIEARGIEVAPINLEKLEGYIPEIRAFTQMEPEYFCGELHQLLAECGVVIVFLPHISGSFLHGASFVDGAHIVLGLTVRGRDADRFWFSLFHELDHILKGHIYNTGETTKSQEEEADSFAADTLIPPQILEEYKASASFGKEEIIKFAEEINIDPGIVLGRLQRDNLVSYDRYRELKKQYKIN